MHDRAKATFGGTSLDVSALWRAGVQKLPGHLPRSGRSPFVQLKQAPGRLPRSGCLPGTLQYILSVRAFSSFAPVAKVWFTPSHAFSGWQERIACSYMAEVLKQRVERKEYLPCFCRPCCALCCINLLYMRFHCQVGILALENHQNSIYSHRRLYIIASRCEWAKSSHRNISNSLEL